MIDFIVVHERPHLDELTAAWLLKRLGKKKFPGIEKAEIIIGTADDKNEEAILLGIGGGPFDEHPREEERKEGECCATLVAKHLGVDDAPALEKILKNVLQNDLHGGGDFLGTANVIKVSNRDLKKVTDWIFFALDNLYREQAAFWTATKRQFEEVASTEEIPGPNGNLKMVTVMTGDEQIAKYARLNGAALVIQKQPEGNVQIFTNQKFGLHLYDVVQLIRLAEQERKGEFKTEDWRTLSSEGTVEGSEEWFFHKGIMGLFNGSLSHPDVTPTKLSLKEIKELVKIGVNPAAFEPKRAKGCKAGRCIGTRKNPCPWYSWGLHRCRKIRYQMKK